MIYFIQCGHNGSIKIGYTDKKASIRMAAIQVCCPYELEIIGIMEGSYAEEQELQKKFKYIHIRGEWFQSDVSLLRYINGKEKITFSDLCEMEPKLFDLFHEIILHARENPNQNHLMKWLSIYKKRMCLLVGELRKYDSCDTRLTTSEAYDIAYGALTSQLNLGDEYEHDPTDYSGERKILSILLWDKLWPGS